MNDTAVTIAALLRRRAASGDLWVDARGGSMGRRYPPGTRLFVRPSGRRPRPGQVWVFVDIDAQVVAHRCVWRRTADSYWFRGDASIRFDAPVDSARLVGPADVVDDGTSRWSPRWWHAVRPSVAAVVRSLRNRLWLRRRIS